jgi:hypothetical protein
MNADIILAPLQVLAYTGSRRLCCSLPYNIGGRLSMNANIA